MASAPNQLTLSFEPTITDRYPTLREFMAARLHQQDKAAKAIASDMDLSPSTLSRKLSPHDGDTQRFNVDDLERFIQVTGDVSAIEYLASKYLQSDAQRNARAVARLESLMPEITNALAILRGQNKR